MLLSKSTAALAALMLALSGAACAQKGSTSITLRDRFEAEDKQIDQRYWEIKQVPGRAFIQTSESVAELNMRRRDEKLHDRLEYAPDGRQAIVVRAFPWDTATDMDGRNIVKHELWLERDRWIPAETEAWYAFWIHVDLTHDDGPDTRFVVAQWKEEPGEAKTGSPFVALRYDAKQLSITVQDDDCRVTIATARRAPSQPDCKKIRLANEANVEIPAPRLRNANRWTELQLGIRRGRTDDGRKESGSVTVYQRGTDGAFHHVVTATGNIGNKDAGPLGYFKFGVYRDYDVSECFRSRRSQRCAVIDVRLDDFRRAASRAELPASELSATVTRAAKK